MQLIYQPTLSVLTTVSIELAMAWGNDPAANDFSDIWPAKSTKSDQLAAAWEAPGSANDPLQRMF